VPLRCTNGSWSRPFLGHGTGIVARIVAAKVSPSGAVAGVDLNPEMLNVARSFNTRVGAASVQWQEASADKLPFPDGSFDVAYCQLGLQFFADRPAALREMRRVLSTKGRVAVMVWCGIQESPDLKHSLRCWNETLVQQLPPSCVRHLDYPTPTS
jgi:ubiquinone/menaquinone biosynthesis C-methylase UbiE